MNTTYKLGASDRRIPLNLSLEAKHKLIMNNIGERIKELRELKGLTQKELAAFLGINTTLVCKKEKGASPLTIKELLKLAEFFNVTTDSLLGRSEIITGISLSEKDIKLLRQYHNTPKNIQDTINGIIAEYGRNR